MVLGGKDRLLPSMLVDGLHYFHIGFEFDRRRLGISLIVTFSAICRLNRDRPVVTRERNQNEPHRPPPSSGNFPICPGGGRQRY